MRTAQHTLQSQEHEEWRVDSLRSKRPLTIDVAAGHRPALRGGSDAGFTMVEIAICLAVIAFALVAIIGVLPIGMSAQKENREETVINFDAHYLMDAIRNGAQNPGQDTLSFCVLSITNIVQIYNITANGQGATVYVPLGGPITNWYNTSTNNSGQFYSVNNTPYITPILTNGFNIVGLLSKPKFIYSGGRMFSNYVSADFRGISAAASDLGNNQASYDFAFRYRVIPEITPLTVWDASLTNYTDSSLGNNANLIAARSNAYILAKSQQNNLAEIRLGFRWPILPTGAAGNSGQVFRTAASGMITNITSAGLVCYFFQPFSYGSYAPKP